MNNLKKKYDEKYQFQGKSRFVTTFHDGFIELFKVEAARRNLNYNDFITIAVSEYLEGEKRNA